MSTSEKPFLNHFVTDFLTKAKTRILSKKRDVIKRQKNKDFVSEQGINYTDIYNILLQLTIDDFISGPLEDYNPEEPDPVWIFKIYSSDSRLKEYDIEEDIYIKLKIRTCTDELVCLAFHKDEQDNYLCNNSN